MTRSTSRTLAGIAIPMATIWFAAVFTFLAWRHGSDARWLGMDRFERMGAIGIVILGALATEWLVLRQMRFIKTANLTEAVVDQVRTVSWAKEMALADYHFFTDDGRVITSRCAIPPARADQWQRGMKITAIYDPNRPAKHAIDARLWAVHGELRITPTAAQEQSEPMQYRAAA